jgi:DNA-binding MarR family transcriptional regulator
MTNRYNNIQLLISLWADFELSESEPDISNFGEWLITMHKPENNQNAEQDSVSNSPGKQEKEDEIRQSFLGLISRISRLQDFYIKRLFEGIPLNNLLEFSFLSFINKNASIRKKEIINYHLVEYTTGIDIIKRLIKLGLVSETKDMLDKRSKRLKITTEGKGILMQALISMNKIGAIFLNRQKTENLSNILKVLAEIEEYHRKVYAESSTNTSYEILQSSSTSEENTF